MSAIPNNTYVVTKSKIHFDEVNLPPLVRNCWFRRMEQNRVTKFMKCNANIQQQMHAQILNYLPKMDITR